MLNHFKKQSPPKNSLLWIDLIDLGRKWFVVVKFQKNLFKYLSISGAASLSSNSSLRKQWCQLLYIFFWEIIMAFTDLQTDQTTI